GDGAAALWGVVASAGSFAAALPASLAFAGLIGSTSTGTKARARRRDDSRHHPRVVPGAVAGDETLALLWPPGAGRVRVDRRGGVEQRLKDAPGLLDTVLT